MDQSSKSAHVRKSSSRRLSATTAKPYPSFPLTPHLSDDRGRALRGRVPTRAGWFAVVLRKTSTRSFCKNLHSWLPLLIGLPMPSEGIGVKHRPRRSPRLALELR
jgi:hypothetical protein